MLPDLHLLLVEPELHRTQMLMRLLSSLLRTIVYAEHQVLLQVVRLGLPSLSTFLWLCSQSELVLLVTPLLNPEAD